MKKYCNVEPILHLLSDKDLLESVNVGAVLQALQHGLYNGEVAPVVHAHWIEEEDLNCNPIIRCSACKDVWHIESDSDAFGDHFYFCPNCGAKMDEKEGNI